MDSSKPCGILPTCKPKEKGFLFAAAKERFSNNRNHYCANPDVKFNDTPGNLCKTLNQKI